MKAKEPVGAFNQEKALVRAFSVITNLRMQLFEALMEAGLRRIVTMHDEQYSQMRFGGGGPGGVAPGGPLPLVLPSVPGHKRVVYTIYEYAHYLQYLQYLPTISTVWLLKMKFVLSSPIFHNIYSIYCMYLHHPLLSIQVRPPAGQQQHDHGRLDPDREGHQGELR